MSSRLCFQTGRADGRPFQQPVWRESQAGLRGAHSNPLPLSSPGPNPSEPPSSSTPWAGRPCRSCPPPCGHPHLEDGPYSPESSGAELSSTPLLTPTGHLSVRVKTTLNLGGRAAFPLFPLGLPRLGAGASPTTHQPSGPILRRWVRNNQMFIKKVCPRCLGCFSCRHSCSWLCPPASVKGQVG